MKTAHNNRALRWKALRAGDHPLFSLLRPGSTREFAPLIAAGWVQDRGQVPRALLQR
ncbi:MAG: hypothetical protein IT159_01040 [Bryobacterales bacterium]|nr:hypothetical protein [Bryobacterales bacterium]